jgi:hypothetical protein
VCEPPISLHYVYIVISPPVPAPELSVSQRRISSLLVRIQDYPPPASRDRVYNGAIDTIDLPNALWDGLDFEMESDERKHQTSQVLFDHPVEESSTSN